MRQSTGCGLLGSRRGLGGEEGDGCRGPRAGDLGDWRERRFDSLAVWSPIKAKADVEANIPLAEQASLSCAMWLLSGSFIRQRWDGISLLLLLLLRRRRKGNLSGLGF
jgi:hypothetical protein